MKFVEQLQHYIGEYLLDRESAAHNRHIIVNNIDSVTNAGILFTAGNEENYRVVSKFALLLKKEGVKEVKMLGYVNDKKLPPFLSPKLGQDFILKSELNWHLKPISVAAMNFIHHPFDILIDLSPAGIFPLKYILGKSTAHFKVGCGNSGKDHLLDLMINSGNGDGIEALSKHIMHYLGQINKIDGDVLARMK